MEKVIKAIEANFGANKQFSFTELEEKCVLKGETLKRHLKALEGFNLVSHNGTTRQDSKYMLLPTWPLMSDKRVCANPNPLGLYIEGWHGYELDPSELPNAERL